MSERHPPLVGQANGREAEKWIVGSRVNKNNVLVMKPGERCSFRHTVAAHLHDDPPLQLQIISEENARESPLAKRIAQAESEQFLARRRPIGCQGTLLL